MTPLATPSYGRPSGGRPWRSDGASGNLGARASGRSGCSRHWRHSSSPRARRASSPRRPSPARSPPGSVFLKPPRASTSPRRLRRGGVLPLGHGAPPTRARRRSAPTASGRRRPADTADYKTRILVDRPTKPKKFNGTVVVEWLNVSGGVDAAPDWTFAHTELIREGYAWVGRLGAEGRRRRRRRPARPQPARSRRSTRRATARSSHPGDSFSYDMFSQVGAGHPAARPAPTPLGDLRREARDRRRRVAVGVPHGHLRRRDPPARPRLRRLPRPQPRRRRRAAVASRRSRRSPSPTPAFIRDRPRRARCSPSRPRPTSSSLGFFPARQPDDRHVRLWEVAGTAHADAYRLVARARPTRATAALDTTYLPPVTSIFGVIDVRPADQLRPAALRR